MKKNLFLIASFTLGFFVLNAQVTAPKYVNEFLQIGVGARSFGMSGAQIASVSDVTAGYWNPAGLLQLTDRWEFATMHNEYFAGIAKYDFISAGKKVDDKTAVAGTIVRFGVDDIPNTLDLYDPNGNVDYSRITTFNAADYAFIFSIARDGFTTKSNFVNQLKFGGNVKLIYRNIGSFANAFGIGFDLGAQMKKEHWSAGLVIRDATSTFNAWMFNLNQSAITVFQNTGNALPENGLEIALPRFIAGGAYHGKWNKKIKGEELSYLIESNVQLTTDGQRNTLVSMKGLNLDPNVGFELGYANTLFLRGGIGNIQRSVDFDNTQYMSFQPNIGVGIRLRKWFLDYALSDVGNQSDVPYSNVFSLKIKI
jgi:hypothetical protein